MCDFELQDSWRGLPHLCENEDTYWRKNKLQRKDMWLLKVFPLQHGLLKNATAVVHLEIWRIMGADVCSVTCGGKSDCVSLLQEEETLEEK